MVKRSFGISLKGNLGIKELVRQAQVGEALGYGNCWISEDYFFGGAFSIATAIAAHTSSLNIGIGVLNPYTRHPALTAMEAAALGSFCDGRLFLGLGASNAFWIQSQMDIPFEKPLAAIEDCVHILREMMAGGTVNYSGKKFSVKNASLELTPPKPIPIYLGMKNEKGLRLAGATADGVLFSAGNSVPYIKWAKQQILAGAEEAGRDFEGMDLAAYLLVSIDPDRKKAREAVKDRLARTIGLHGEQRIMLEAGFEPEQLKTFHQLFLEKKRVGHLVTEKMIDKLVIAGTPEECQGKMQELFDAGVTQAIVLDISEIDMAENLKFVRKYLFPLAETE